MSLNPAHGADAAGAEQEVPASAAEERRRQEAATQQEAAEAYTELMEREIEGLREVLAPEPWVAVGQPQPPPGPDPFVPLAATLLALDRLGVLETAASVVDLARDALRGEPRPEAEADAHPRSDAMPEPEPEPELEPAPATEPETEPNHQPELMPDTQAEPLRNLAPGVEPGVQIETTQRLEPDPTAPPEQAEVDVAAESTSDGARPEQPEIGRASLDATPIADQAPQAPDATLPDTQAAKDVAAEMQVDGDVATQIATEVSTAGTSVGSSSTSTMAAMQGGDKPVVEPERQAAVGAEAGAAPPEAVATEPAVEQEPLASMPTTGAQGETLVAAVDESLLEEAALAELNSRNEVAAADHASMVTGPSDAPDPAVAAESAPDIGDGEQQRAATNPGQAQAADPHVAELRSEASIEEDALRDALPSSRVEAKSAEASTSHEPDALGEASDSHGDARMQSTSSSDPGSPAADLQPLDEASTAAPAEPMPHTAENPAAELLSGDLGYGNEASVDGCDAAVAFDGLGIG